MLLIIASSMYQNDPQIDLLKKVLESQSVDFILVNPFNHSDLRRLRVVCHHGVSSVHYDGQIVDVRKVYVARHFRADCILNVPERCELTTLYRYKVDIFLNELCAILGDKSWFPGTKQNLLDSDLKCHLYQVAHAIGLLVPERTENSFSKPQSLQYQKSLGAPFTLTFDRESNDEIAVTLQNSIVTEDDSGGLPWQWQSNITPRLQIRCVVIGNKVWAFEASESQFQGKSLREYQLENDVVWKSHLLPEAVSTKLLSLTTEFELQFACPEFLVDSEGRYHFIDLNPCGDWYGFGSEDESLEIVNEIAMKLRV